MKKSYFLVLITTLLFANSFAIAQEEIQYKQDGKFYYSNGELVPETELYTVTIDAKSMLLAKDMKAEFKNTNSKYVKIEPNAKTLVQELKIEKNVADNRLVSIKNKNYIVKQTGDKVGLTTVDGKEILPSEFDKINVKTPSKYFLSPVLLVEKNGIQYIYNMNGKLLAEQTYGKINVYKYGKVYSYFEESDSGVVTQNGVKIGTITYQDNNYIFEKTRFTFIPHHRVIELLLIALPTTNI